MAITLFRSNPALFRAMGVSPDEAFAFTDPMNTMADEGAVALDETEGSMDPDILSFPRKWESPAGSVAEESPATRFFDRFIDPLNDIVTAAGSTLADVSVVAPFIGPLLFAAMPPAQAVVVAPFMGLTSPDESGNYETPSSPDKPGKYKASAAASPARDADKKISPTNVLGTYLSQIAKTPLLTHEEEADIATRMGVSRLEYLKLVWSLAPAVNALREAEQAIENGTRTAGSFITNKKADEPDGADEADETPTEEIKEDIRPLFVSIYGRGDGFFAALNRIRPAVREAIEDSAVRELAEYVDATRKKSPKLRWYGVKFGFNGITALAKHAKIMRYKALMNKEKGRLVEANLRFVVSVAKTYKKGGPGLLDLIQAGNIGLMKAIDRFEAERGNRVTTFAEGYIDDAIRDALTRDSRTIRLTEYAADRVRRFNDVKARLTQEFNREPTREELAEALGISTKDATRLELAARRPVSLYKLVGRERKTELGRLIPDKTTPLPDAVAEASELFRGIERVIRLLPLLPALEERVFRLAFGIDGDELDLTEIGGRLSLLRHSVRYVRDAAIARLRGWLNLPEGADIEPGARAVSLERLDSTGLDRIVKEPIGTLRYVALDGKRYFTLGEVAKAFKRRVSVGRLLATAYDKYKRKGVARIAVYFAGGVGKHSRILFSEEDVDKILPNSVSGKFLQILENYDLTAVPLEEIILVYDEAGRGLPSLPAANVSSAPRAPRRNAELPDPLRPFMGVDANDVGGLAKLHDKDPLAGKTFGVNGAGDGRGEDDLALDYEVAIVRLARRLHDFSDGNTHVINGRSRTEFEEVEGPFKEYLRLRKAGWGQDTDWLVRLVLGGMVTSLITRGTKQLPTPDLYMQVEGLIIMISRQLAKRVLDGKQIPPEAKRDFPDHKKYLNPNEPTPKVSEVEALIERSLPNGGRRKTLIAWPGNDTVEIDAALKRGEKVYVFEPYSGARKLVEKRYGKRVAIVRDLESAAERFDTIRCSFNLPSEILPHVGKLLKPGGIIFWQHTTVAARSKTEIEASWPGFDLLLGHWGRPIYKTLYGVGEYPVGVEAVVLQKQTFGAASAKSTAATPATQTAVVGITVAEPGSQLLKETFPTWDRARAKLKEGEIVMELPNGGFGLYSGNLEEIAAVRLHGFAMGERRAAFRKVGGRIIEEVVTKADDEIASVGEGGNKRLIVFKRARNMKTGAVAFVSVTFPPKGGVYYNSDGHEVLKVSSFPFRENGRTKTEFMGELVTDGLDMPDGFQLFGSPIFVIPSEALRTTAVVNGGADDAASDGSFKIETPEYSDLKGMAVGDVADIGTVRVAKLSEFDQEMGYHDSDVRVYYESGNKRGFIVFPPQWSPSLMPPNRIVISLELLHRAAAGEEIEATLSEFIETPEGYPLSDRYGANIYAERGDAGNVEKVVVGYNLGVSETGTIEFPWTPALASDVPDINALAQAVSGRKPLAMLTDGNLTQFRLAMERALEDIKGYDLLSEPLSADPYWDMTNFSGFPRLDHVIEVLKFYLDRTHPLVVVNEPGDIVGDAIGARIATGTVVYWKEPNKYRTMVPKQLPPGYKQVAVNAPLQVDISTWNMPSDDALSRGVGYLGRDLAPGGILIVQSLMPPAEWLGDGDGWTVLSEKRLEKGDYVLPARNNDGLYFIMLQKPGGTEGGGGAKM